MDFFQRKENSEENRDRILQKEGQQGSLNLNVFKREKVKLPCVTTSHKQSPIQNAKMFLGTLVNDHLLLATATTWSYSLGISIAFNLL